MAFETNLQALSEKRKRDFLSNSKNSEEKVFVFPELLQPFMFSNADPVPTEVFDLSKTLIISDKQTEAILSGFKEIDTLSGIENALKWLLNEAVVMAKAMNKSFYVSVAGVAGKINEIIGHEPETFLKEDSSAWADGLRTIRRLQFQFNLPAIPISFLHTLVKSKRNEDNFWRLMIELSFHFEESVFIKEVIGREWLNNYYLSLKSKFEEVSELVFKEKEKLLNSEILMEDFNPDRLVENIDLIQQRLKSLSIIFREFEFIKKHAVYNGIISKFLPAYESLKSLEG